MEWAWNLYRTVRALVLFVAAVLRALLAAVVLAEDLWIQARGWVLLQLAERREHHEAAAAPDWSRWPPRSFPTGTWPGSSPRPGRTA